MPHHFAPAADPFLAFPGPALENRCSSNCRVQSVLRARGVRFLRNSALNFFFFAIYTVFAI